MHIEEHPYAKSATMRIGAIKFTICRATLSRNSRTVCGIPVRSMGGQIQTADDFSSMYHRITATASDFFFHD